MSWLDDISIVMVIVVALTLGLAPFVPEPHLFEKIRMLMAGSLVRPMDKFDLVLHASPFVLLILKLARMAVLKQG